MLKYALFNRGIFVSFMFLFGVFFCTQSVYAQEDYVQNQLIVKYKKGGNSAAIKERLAEKGVTGGKNIPELGLEIIDVPPGELDAILEELLQDPDVEYIHKNYYYEPLAVPNDQFYPDQLYFDVIQAEQAWDMETGNPDVIVAVLDTGFDLSHEDLQGGRVLPGCGVGGLDFDHTNCDTDLTDHFSHGTGVFGTIGADTHNSIGVAGLCWGCSLLPIKIYSGSSGSFTQQDAIEGILYVVNYAQNNPTKKIIINMSFGRSCVTTTPAEQDAIDLAWDNGILLVAARGNSGNASTLCPAVGDNVISVTGTNLDDTLWSSSSYGLVDIVAPAVPIYNIAASNLLDPPYIPTYGGTSFSSAIVSGVAGLVWSENISINNWQLNQILMNTADDLGNSAFFGAGRINANAAVVQAPNPPPTPSPTPSPTPPPTPDPNLLSLSAPGGIGVITGKGKAFSIVSNAEPGSVLILMGAFSSDDNGSTVISGNGPCAGDTLFLVDAKKLARATADESGNATFNYRIGAKQQGKSLLTQAYSHSKATVCRKSRTRSVSIPVP